MNCPRCQQEIPAESASCSACGFSFDDATQKLDSDARSSKSKKSQSYSSYDSIDDARFVPGTIIAERYRIVGLLGKGGMGEVYRADDLKLSQPVALKFLPEHLLSDGGALARFHREVRVARQVSHKNVCRVYDIGEVDGRHFLSMEFIKGEELSSLLRRIGRLPQDKAIQIARQICAGLAAAHDVGFLHRDLKPANIMIDGEGNARILDFGLGGLMGEFGEDEVRAGTPAYMSPEQLEGKTLSVKSDIYSLGLVLYELFTGKRAFEASTFNELIRLRRSDTSPTTPSEFVKDLDPIIEKIINHCIRKDPEQRPSSALQVAAALPGGDPIAAALAAGETPSPEMVAAAPKEGALRPRVAIVMFASAMVALALVVLLADKVVLFGFVPLEKSPEVLRERAREIITKLGYAKQPTDYVHKIDHDRAPLEFIAATDRRPDRWQDLNDGQPAPIFYWYRQSPVYLGGVDFADGWANPAPIVSGMTGVKLDTRGRLLSFYAVPSQIDPVSNSESPVASSPQASNTGVVSNPEGFEWSILFREAGLDIANFKETPSQWAPLYVNDQRAAWQGSYPEQPQVPIRIEAASYHGKPVYFQIVAPWDKPERQEPPGLAWHFKGLFILLVSVFVLVLIGSVFLAIRNLRLGRGDRRGALRLAIFIFTLTLAARLLSAHHVPALAELGTVLGGLEAAVFAGLFFWIVYLALEPFVRKRWPHRIISWTRLLGGDFRDPLVGRDILIGALYGFGITVWQLVLFFIRLWLGDPALKPAMEPSSWNLGLGQFVEGFAGQLTTPLLNSFQSLFLILLLSLLFRRDWLGFVVGWLLFAAGIAFIGGGAPANWINGAITAGVIILILYRYGLLAMMAGVFFLHMYIMFPVTTNFTAWYASGFLVDLVIVVALIFYGFYISLAGQPLFRGRLFDES